jgi:hypothetical protein
MFVHYTALTLFLTVLLLVHIRVCVCVCVCTIQTTSTLINERRTDATLTIEIQFNVRKVSYFARTSG